MFHLNFRREITLLLMKSARANQPQIREPQAPADVRHDGVGHFPECTRYAGVPIFVEHWGDNLQFCPIFNIGG